MNTVASRLCPFCMQMADGDTCPHCGKNVNYAGSPAHLPAGYVVSGKHPYVLGAALGQGGFGITYIALDMVTNERVAIKEYYPTYCSTRADTSTVTAYSNQEEVFLKGKERFLDEARTLKSLSDLNNIVNVLDFFEANNTAYLVMEFLDGSSLKEHAAQHGKFPAQKFLSQIKPLMEDIHRMHERGVVHRDIAPDNIILLPDGQMKLIDFGAARSYVGDKSMTVVVKKGFAPVEQYMSKGSTACTDVYALAATIYYCITGTVPPDSAERQYDNALLSPPTTLGADLSATQEKALFQALEVLQKNRTQSVQTFLEMLCNKNLSLKKDRIRNPDDPKPKQSVSVKPTVSGSKVVPGKKTKNKKKPDPQNDTPVPPSKKAALKIAVAMLAVITLLGLLIALGKANDSAWQKNVLMADTTFDQDYSYFWADKQSAPYEKIYSYFSNRPIFNTDIPRSKVTDIFFLDSLSTAPDQVYDVSAKQDNTVLAWTQSNEKGGLSLYIAGEGGINGVYACRSLFYGYTELESIHFNDAFFTDTAQNMSGMFAYCKNLKTLDLDNLNTASATNMSNMFCCCVYLTSLDLSSFDTANVTDMSQMFYNCDQLTLLDLSSFNTENVTNMESMFGWCNQLTSLDLSHFDTANVTDMSQMFSSCNHLTSLNLSSFDTANVIDMSQMFSSCDQLTSLNLSNFDTANVADMSQMFSSCNHLTSLNLSSFDTSNVIDMSQMFYNCNQLTSLNLSLFNTSNVTNMRYMFYGCKQLTSLNLSSFNTANVTNMESMFGWCNQLTSLSLSGFGTTNVTNMKQMFYSCDQLISLDLSHFDTANVTDMSQMFCGCNQLKSLDLRHFDTANVTDMSQMFCSCDHLTSLDLSNFDTANVTDMSKMFFWCDRLMALDLSSFDTSNVNNYKDFMDSGEKVNGRPWQELFQ